MKNTFIAGLSLLLFSGIASADRLKDLAAVDGVRGNQLIGYGLVVGLDGTGDQTSQAQFTVQSLRNLLTQLGVTIPPNINPQLKNVAAVAVHAELPPFAKPGQTIDVTVSSLANAGSLRGGSLLMTPLKGADGEIYALAQGSMVVGGFGASGRDGSRIAVNIPSAGRIPGGAIVEREVPMSLNDRPYVTLHLHSADFTTAARLTESVNAVYGPGVAETLDSVSVRVRAPTNMTQRIAFLAELENMEIDPGQAAARVVVNSRTGTIVIGSTVRVQPAAVAHGSLSVTITEGARISQPAPFSGGETVVVPESQIEIRESGGKMFLFEPGVTLADLVRAVNEVGAAPGDLIAILEALKQVGALRAELVII
jgi:flagellar P-ring protein precursor FlgI